MLKIDQINYDNDIEGSISINISTKFGVNLIIDLSGNEECDEPMNGQCVFYTTPSLAVTTMTLNISNDESITMT